jgi:hypothetical protein
MEFKKLLREVEEYLISVENITTGGFTLFGFVGDVPDKNKLRGKLCALGGDIFGVAAIEELIGNLDEPFSQTLMRLIDSKKMKDTEVYTRANIDRRLFAKIRKPDYRPSKNTVLALAIALELDLSETEHFLKRAGFALSYSQKSDVIIEYFIKHKMYNIHKINMVLLEYEQQKLGG